MMTSNQRTIAKQEELIHKLAWNDGFGCHTRKGFEHVIWPSIAATAQYIIYFDIDGMHALNESFGSYEPVDAMIRQVLHAVRSSDYVAGQWKSGDEFLICLTQNQNHNPLDPEGLVKRLTEEFAKVGMTATFAIVPVKGTDLLENVQPAVEKVYELKKARGISR
jgi:GGDEF domain-containing protein